MTDFYKLLKNTDNNVFCKEIYMAKIIENKKGRRQVKLNFADIQWIIEEYQTQFTRTKDISKLKKYFEFFGIFLPEDV